MMKAYNALHILVRRISRVHVLHASRPTSHTGQKEAVLLQVHKSAQIRILTAVSEAQDIHGARKSRNACAYGKRTVPSPKRYLFFLLIICTTILFKKIYKSQNILIIRDLPDNFS
jgi:hypothetical protein